MLQHALMSGGPDFSLEQTLFDQGCLRVAGVDEVGRGPLAGPVTAAAVRLDPSSILVGLNDSKKLSEKRRHVLYDKLMSTADVSVGHATVEEIDQINILRAAHLAMERAIAGLAVAPDHLLIDGNLIPQGIDAPAKAVVQGDTKSVSIAAASIVAKVTRDRIMVDLAQHFPGYGWETNMGYPSSAHREALFRLGPTPHHRRSFKPVHNILLQAKSITT